MPSPSTITPPAAPIRLMTAFALERSGLIVTSGISATAGERNVPIATNSNRRMQINATKGAGCASVTDEAYACRAGTTYAA